MLTTLLLAVVLIALAVNASLLWLGCKLLSVRHPAADGRPATAVSFRRSLLVAACSLAATALIGAVVWALPGDGALLPLNAHVVFSLILSLIVVRAGLPVNWPRALLVAATWTGLCVPALLLAACLGPLAFAGFVVTGPDGADLVLGPHQQFTCPQCGHAFVIADAANPADHATFCTCPNCRETIPFSSDVPTPAGYVPEPPTLAGDRVLAGRRLLGVGALPPERFDLVAFERSAVGHGKRLLADEEWAGRDGRSQFGVSRLVGLPRETIAIHRGDLFVLDGDAAPAPGRDDPLAREGNFRILRKPPAKVLSLMRLVYDSRHPAKDLAAPDDRRWAGDEGSGWRESAGFRHDGRGDEVAWLRYRHVLRPNAGKPSLITDFDGHNAWQPRRQHREHWVGDLILECEADPGSAGQLILELSRGPDRFRALFDLDRQTCSLVRVTEGEAETLKTEAVRVPAKKARLRFADVDERLTVWVDERLVFGDGVEYDGPARLLPRKENDLDRPASVGAKGAAVVIRRLRLLRDAYYVTEKEPGRQQRGWLGDDARGFDPTAPGTWETLRWEPVLTQRMAFGHYFLLGDNSQESDDSRSWGPIHERQLIGKALLRYGSLSRLGRIE